MAKQMKNDKRNNVNASKQSNTLKNNTKSKYKKGKYAEEDLTPNYFLIPIFIIICIIPLIVKYAQYNPRMSQFNWFANSESQGDFFLFYKHWTFVAVASIMAFIVALKVYFNRYTLHISKMFIPLAVYAGLALLSSIFSKYASFSFTGSFELFESIFAILGYCIAAFYAYIFIKSEKDLRLINKFLIAIALIISVLGLLQFISHDFFTTDAAYQLILPLKYQNGEPLTFSFGKSTVYATLYNPNYVGTFVALIMPILLVLLLFQKKIGLILLSIISIIGLLICVVGARSAGGFIGLSVAVIFILIFLWRYMAKRYYITIPVVLVLVIGIIVVNIVTDEFLVKKIMNMFTNANSSIALTQMDTLDDRITLTYNGNKMYVTSTINDDQTISVEPKDENDQAIACSYDETNNKFVLTDERFTGISVGADAQYAGVIFIEVNGTKWYFTNQMEDGTYYYLNAYGKWDKMITAPSALFKGMEAFASGRGYIWSRTIPLLKNYIILGSGPDTYTCIYPHQDYLNLQNYGFGTAVLTKPHNMYLQMAVQTGILSLIAFLIFYGWYFITSVRLYIKGCFHSTYAKYGLAIFCGTIAYMVTGLVNDSSITTAPIFWTLIGVGIAANYKAKQFVYEEYAKVKEEKSNKN